MAFFGGGASVDLASPPAIGNTTPNTGAFTTLSANNGTITTSSPAFTMTQTWNSSAQTFTALRVDVTDTASGGNSLLMQLRVGGSQRLAVTKQGSIGCHSNIGLLGFLGFATAGDPIGNIVVGFQRVSDSHIRVTSDQSTISASLSALSFFVGATDVVLARDSANTLAQRNSTNAQTFRLYRTFTDASNYERLSLIATRTTRFAIAAENAGTGAARSLEISFYTSASDPTSTDITSGCFSVWKNSGTGTISLWANDGGTMKSVALA